MFEPYGRAWILDIPSTVVFFPLLIIFMIYQYNSKCYDVKEICHDIIKYGNINNIELGEAAKRCCAAIVINKERQKILLLRQRETGLILSLTKVSLTKGQCSKR